MAFEHLNLALTSTDPSTSLSQLCTKNGLTLPMMSRWFLVTIVYCNVYVCVVFVCLTLLPFVPPPIAAGTMDIVSASHKGKVSFQGCFDCCVRCIGAVPYPSLVATLLCYAGTALFCGCGHEALAHTEVLIETYFARNAQDYVVLASFIKYFQYVIYGLASFFFLYGILLLAEGFYTTSAVKQTFGEFRSTHCGRCLSLTFIIVTYILGFIWLAVFAFTAIPVFFLFNMEQTCHDINMLAETTPSINQHSWICMDARQYGLLPWNAMPGKSCGMTLASICKTSEFHFTYDLYIAAFAGAGITLLSLFLYLAATTYNYAILRFLGRKGIC